MTAPETTSEEPITLTGCLDIECCDVGYEAYKEFKHRYRRLPEDGELERDEEASTTYDHVYRVTLKGPLPAHLVAKRENT